MLEQGGFIAEHKSDDAFLKVIRENPAKQHEFAAVRSRLIRIKQEQPNCRFRLEIQGCTMEKVSTSMRAEAGLEKPEEFFVELATYEAEHGPVNQADVVTEEIDGVMCQGVP